MPACSQGLAFAAVAQLDAWEFSLESVEARGERSFGMYQLGSLKQLFFSPTAESFGVSAQIGSGMVRGGPEVRFHEGSTRVLSGFHQGSTRVPPWFYRVLLRLRGGAH